jgi:hypothetical protein
MPLLASLTRRAIACHMDDGRRSRDAFFLIRTEIFDHTVSDRQQYRVRRRDRRSAFA